MITMSTDVVRTILIGAWALAGLVLTVRRPKEPLGPVVLAAAALGLIGSLVDSLAPLALGLLPAAGLHILLGMPDGSLRTNARRITSGLGFVLGVVSAAILWSNRPDLPAWPVLTLSALAAVVGTAAFVVRYRSLNIAGQRRMRWFAWGVIVSAGLAVVAFGLDALVGWPSEPTAAAAAATVLIPLSLVAGSSRRLDRAIDPLLVTTISLAGLTALVVAVYLAIVLGLGRVPKQSERTLLVLSMVAAGLCALLYFPVHERLSGVAKRIVYRQQRAPDEAIRTFGTRMSRAIPLDELLLQLTESLRRTLALTSAEVWTLGTATLHVAAADPERERPPIHLGNAERDALTRAGTTGNAWAKIWLPDLLAGRDEAQVRLAPIVHSGELLGLLVTERGADATPLSEEEERTLIELARQVGLTLHNVRLDSALQASLDEVRRQAQELQASRGRIVAASDAARRSIERNLHDGAQQHLVALAVKVRLAQQLADRDPGRAKALVGELGGDIEETIKELRDLAHGIYPPLLADKGLPEALASAARRAALPTTIDADGIGRYPPEREAAVYFCCLEALQNAGKYAGEGATATVRLHEEAGGLIFEVRDDGAGFDVAARGVGAGFVNMNDRLGAVGGSLRVESTPGRGTRVTGMIPLDHTSDRAAAPAG
jgi:signal transduction histidine kinase